MKHILVPTDGSDGALKAARVAGNLARALHAEVTVLLVQSDDLIVSSAWGVGNSPDGSPAGTMSVDELRTMLEKRAGEKELPDTVAALGSLDKPATSLVRWGPASEVVCEFARNNDVDLIVIGSHGRTGLKRAILGSVSHAVANQAPCPVTIVR